MKKILLLLILITCNLSSGQNQANYRDFVPKNWKITKEARGDLNKDKLEDIVLVIEDTDKQNFVTNDTFGPDTLNLNPRKLLVLFKINTGFYLASENDQLIGSENSEINSCLEDPLENGDVYISERGNLVVRLNYWLSCGSWFAGYHQYTFSWRDNEMKYIGYDHYSYHRSSGENSSTSINFLTGKRKDESGGNEFEDGNPVSKWSTFKGKRNLKLHDVNSETFRSYYE